MGAAARSFGLHAVFPPPMLPADFDARLAALAASDFAVLGVEARASIAGVAERLGWRPLRVAARLQRAGLVTDQRGDWPDAEL